MQFTQFIKWMELVIHEDGSWSWKISDASKKKWKKMNLEVLVLMQSKHCRWLPLTGDAISNMYLRSLRRYYYFENHITEQSNKTNITAKALPSYLWNLHKHAARDATQRTPPHTYDMIILFGARAKIPEFLLSIPFSLFPLSISQMYRWNPFSSRNVLKYRISSRTQFDWSKFEFARGGIFVLFLFQHTPYIAYWNPITYILRIRCDRIRRDST